MIWTDIARVAAALLIDYSSVYCIDFKTGRYVGMADCADGSGCAVTQLIYNWQSAAQQKGVL